MSSTQEIGILRGVLININIMIGASLFVNPNPLANLVGPWGFCSYLLCALLFLPVILSIAELATLHPVSGGLYVYSKEHLHPFAGFISGWSYFIGKTASCAFLTDAFVKYFYTRIPALQGYPRIYYDFLLIGLMILANIYGMRIGGRIQYLFTTLKMIPAFFVIVVGAFYFTATNFDAPALLHNMGNTLPIVALAYSGFEVTCLIAHMIKDSHKNARTVILTSFATVVVIYALFQMAIFGALGYSLTTTNEPVLALANKAFAAYPLVGALINGFVFCSVMGGCFGILTSNCWNLHRLGHDKLLPFNTLLTRVNAQSVPWVSLIIEGLIICTILAVNTQQVALQNMAIFGIVISYLLSTLAAFAASRHGKLRRLYQWIPLAGIVSCFLILIMCLQKLFSSGLSTPFIVLFFTGTVATLAYTQFMKKGEA